MSFSLEHLLFKVLLSYLMNMDLASQPVSLFNVASFVTENFNDLSAIRSDARL